MKKMKHLTLPVMISLVLAVVLSVVLLNSISTPALAQICAVGGCFCDCENGVGCNTYFDKIPSAGVDIYGCSCADGSENCEVIES